MVKENEWPEIEYSNLIILSEWNLSNYIWASQMMKELLILETYTVIVLNTTACISLVHVRLQQKTCLNCKQSLNIFQILFICASILTTIFKK